MTLRETRGFIARCLLCEETGGPVSTGSITLRRHQESALNRVSAAIDEFGGALLSDHVGTGKTYVALALAARTGEATVVAPAVLKDMWLDAASLAGVSIMFISTESLSRAGISRGRENRNSSKQLMIVDEAQHFRNPATRRFTALARLCSGRRVLLLSATPIHNSSRDLVTVLSLFAGSRAAAFSQSETGRIVIRRSRDEVAGSARLPVLAPPQWCDLTHDDEIPRLLLSLPPPLSPRNGGDGGALVAHSLIRQWVSSDAALYRALVRRRQRATALVSSLENGTYPSQQELAAWISGEDCVQLGFAALLSPEDSESAAHLPIVRRHVEAIERLSKRLKVSNSRDVERAAIISGLRRKHSGVSIVAFSQYADTVEALFELIAPEGSVAVLTGTGARVSGGRISRHEAIGRFAPRASGRSIPRAAEAVTLLLTTDLLSEGVNLQDAGVVIHLDLPWTPARMEQRLGRVARMGSEHERVFSYAMRPPASADSLIRTERTLKKKMISAGIVTDGIQAILPDTVPSFERESIPQSVEELRHILRQWLPGASEIRTNGVLTSAVRAQADGLIALCRVEGRYQMLVSDSGRITDDPALVVRLMRLVTEDEVRVGPSEFASAIRSVHRFLFATRAIGSREAQGHHTQAAKRMALRRIARIATGARPHEKLRLAAASARARSVIVGRLGANQEARLASLAEADLSDRDWLRAVIALSDDEASSSEPDDIVAMILLREFPL